MIDKGRHCFEKRPDIVLRDDAGPEGLADVAT
jgi:hypothetical protein